MTDAPSPIPAARSEPKNGTQGVPRAQLTAWLRDAIERMILNGEIPLGDPINEKALAARFAVSRGPIREAVRGLEQTGLVRVIPNRGVFVRQRSVEEILDLYDIRAGLATAAGRLLARRATAAQVAELQAVYDDMAAACEAGDSEGYADLSEVFHRKLMAFCGNRRLAEINDNVEKELRLIHRRTTRGPERLRHSNRHHAGILEAVRAGDEKAAAAAFEQDILDGKRHFLETLA